jgi:hypothetical protein
LHLIMNLVLMRANSIACQPTKPHHRSQSFEAANEGWQGRSLIYIRMTWRSWVPLSVHHAHAALQYSKKIWRHLCFSTMSIAVYTRTLMFLDFV